MNKLTLLDLESYIQSNNLFMIYDQKIYKLYRKPQRLERGKPVLYAKHKTLSGLAESVGVRCSSSKSKICSI